MAAKTISVALLPKPDMTRANSPEKPRNNSASDGAVSRPDKDRAAASTWTIFSRSLSRDCFKGFMAPWEKSDGQTVVNDTIRHRRPDRRLLTGCTSAFADRHVLSNPADVRPPVRGKPERNSGLHSPWTCASDSRNAQRVPPKWIRSRQPLPRLRVQRLLHRTIL